MKETESVKNSLRRETRNGLAAINQTSMVEATKNLSFYLQKFLSSSSCAGKTILCAWVAYFPGEVNLTSLINEELKRRNVYLPRVVWQMDLEFIRIDENWERELELGRNGIPEPPSENAQVLDILQGSSLIILVPALLVDLDGYRLGRGGGCYDRFLNKDNMKEALKVGVGWEQQLVQRLPREAHDIKLDCFCTEEKLISFR